MSEKGFRVEVPVHINRDRRARKLLAKGEVPKATQTVSGIARLLALAWKWELQVRRGKVSYTELARRYGLSRPRVSQICALTLLPPERQERFLENRSRPPSAWGGR